MPEPRAYTPLDHVRALALAGAWAVLLILGTPGLDKIPEKGFEKAEHVEAYNARMPAWTLPIAHAVVAVNREVRLPLVGLFAALQRPLRVNQNWGLYLDGAPTCMRLEIDVDGRMVHRTKDPAYPWLADTLRAPPIRPIVDGTVSKKNGGGNWKGLQRLVVRAAQRDFPGAREVVMRAMWGPFPDCVTTEHHRFVATAPTWGEE